MHNPWGSWDRELTSQEVLDQRVSITRGPRSDIQHHMRSQIINSRTSPEVLEQWHDITRGTRSKVGHHQLEILDQRRSEVPYHQRFLDEISEITEVVRVRRSGDSILVCDNM